MTVMRKQCNIRNTTLVSLMSPHFFVHRQPSQKRCNAVALLLFLCPDVAAGNAFVTGT